MIIILLKISTIYYNHLGYWPRLRFTVRDSVDYYNIREVNGEIFV